MSRHVSEALLSGFVEGTLDEDTAVEVALHLDDCPACASRVAMAEPLSEAFAAIPDPVVPPDLARAVLDAASRPERSHRVEPAIGVALLMVGALLAAVTGDPVRWAVDVGLLLDGVVRAAAVLPHAFVAQVAALAGLVGLGAVAAARHPALALRRFS